MVTFADEIKAWLKSNNKTRVWLAEQCWVQKKTVDGWLSSGKNIPATKLEKIKSLMLNSDRVCEDATPYSIPTEFEQFVLEKIRPVSQKAQKLKEDSEQLQQDINQFVIEVIEAYLNRKI